jgi:hypothetical protein
MSAPARRHDAGDIPTRCPSSDLVGHKDRGPGRSGRMAVAIRPQKRGTDLNHPVRVRALLLERDEWRNAR